MTWFGDTLYGDSLLLPLLCQSLGWVETLVDLLHHWGDQTPTKRRLGAVNGAGEVSPLSCSDSHCLWMVLNASYIDTEQNIINSLLHLVND